MEYTWLPMTDELFDALNEQRQSTDSEWVFPNPKTGQPYTTRKNWMKNLCKNAGVKPFGLHALRHLSASVLAKARIPLIQIQKVLRHKKLSTTEHYLHQLEDVRSALQVLSKKKKPSGGAVTSPSGLSEQTETAITGCFY